MKKEELEELNDRFQDIIAGHSADLETGSHHRNNAASEEFAKHNKYLLEALHEMAIWIKQKKEELV